MNVGDANDDLTFLFGGIIVDDADRWCVIDALRTVRIWHEHRLFRIQAYPIGSMLSSQISRKEYAIDAIRKCDLLPLHDLPLRHHLNHNVCLATLVVYASHLAHKVL